MRNNPNAGDVQNEILSVVKTPPLHKHLWCGGKNLFKRHIINFVTFVMKVTILNPSHYITGKASKDERERSAKHKYLLPLFDDQVQVKPVCLEPGD